MNVKNQPFLLLLVDKSFYFYFVSYVFASSLLFFCFFFSAHNSFFLKKGNECKSIRISYGNASESPQVEVWVMTPQVSVLSDKHEEKQETQD